jgi:hypothetical protein
MQGEHQPYYWLQNRLTSLLDMLELQVNMAVAGDTCVIAARFAVFDT